VSCQLRTSQDIELDSQNGELYKVLKSFDDQVGNFLKTFSWKWNSWLSHVGTLDLDQLIANIKRTGPCTWAAVQTARAPSSSVSMAKKDRIMLLHLIGMLRERNNKFLRNMALIFSFATMARGYSAGSQLVARALRIEASHTALENFMNTNVDQFKRHSQALFFWNGA
jgi:hypothetical protein